MRRFPELLALLALAACGPATPVDSGSPATPPPDPALDTGLPAPQPRSTPALDVRLGDRVLCDDIGREDGFFTRVELPATVPSSDRSWRAGGFSVADFDGDGVLDFFAPTEDVPEYWTETTTGYRDVGSEKFEGIELTRGVGSVAADYDADGDLDLFVTRYGQPNRLLRNDNGGFTDVSELAGIPLDDGRTAAASFGDLNGDGWLDLFVGNYGGVPEDSWDPAMAPGDPSQLLISDGAGGFVDASHQIPQDVHDGYTFQSAFIDIDTDGFPELIVVQDFGWVRPTTLLWNDGGTLVPDDGTASFHPNFAGMGLAIGDIDGDAIPDFAQTSYEELSLLVGAKTSLATRGYAWAEFSSAMGLALDLGSGNQHFGWGTDFGDLDNDGDLDLVMGFGRWDEYANPTNQFDEVWLRDGDLFVPRAASTVWSVNDRGATRGLVLGDFDGDGWLDIAKRFASTAIRVHVSRCSANRHFTKITLRDPGSPNHEAIGARVTVRAGGIVATRWLDTGSRSMFSSGLRELHFGLDDALWIDSIEVVWPDGLTDRVTDLPVDRPLTLTRPAPP